MTDNPPITEPAKKPLKANNKRLSKVLKSKLFGFAIIVVIAAIPSFYFYHKNQLAEQRLRDPNTANQQVIDEVVKKVGRHIQLPTGEQPTLASVSDVSKVKGQPFFANAENGDKVLVYTQARKAILYRPSKDLIIEVAPLNVSSLDTTNGINK